MERMYFKPYFYALTVFFILLFLSSCKKDTAVVYISAEMAHTGEPISGSLYSLVEFDSKGIGGDLEETGFSMTGVVPASGKTGFTFETEIRKTYYLWFDHSMINVPSGDYEIVAGPAGFAGSIDENGGKEYTIRVLPYMEIDFHFYNANCFDSNDSLKFKLFNMDEHPNYTMNDIENLNWVDGFPHIGCEDYWHHSSSILAGHYLCIWEAKKNQVITSGTDTLFISPGGNAIMEITW